MQYDCKCTLKDKGTGDGCITCNTEYAINMLPHPQDLERELANGVFSEDQAYRISVDIYEPLLNIIQVLNKKIDQIALNVD